MSDDLLEDYFEGDDIEDMFTDDKDPQGMPNDIDFAEYFADQEEILIDPHIKDSLDIPHIEFVLYINKKYIRITTNDPVIYRTNFAHPVDVDKTISNLTNIRSFVYEGYLQAERSHRVLKNALKIWIEQKKGQVIKDKKPKELFGRETNDTVNLAFYHIYGSQLHSMQVGVDDAELNAMKLLCLYEQVCDKIVSLQSLNKRFSKDTEYTKTYASAFGDEDDD